MKKNSKLLLLILIPLLLTGCMNKDVIDELSIVEGIGFDSAEGGKISGTVLTPVHQADKPPTNVTYTAVNTVKKTILQDIQRQTSNPIMMGSLDVLLFEDKLAREGGILELVDAFQRDPAVGSGVYIAIVEGSTKEALEGEYGIRGNAAYISRLIEHNLKEEDLPKTNMQRFLSDFYQKGKSPYLPVLKKINNKEIMLTGVGLIRYGKLVDKVNVEDAFFFKLLVDKYSNGLHRVEVEEGEASIQSIFSRHHFTLDRQSPYRVTIDIEVEGLINEFTGNQITSGVMDKLEKQLEKEIESKCLELINRFKEKEIDPVGFGHFISSKVRDFDFEKWNETDYQELEVVIKPTVTIEEAGVIQ